MDNNDISRFNQNEVTRLDWETLERNTTKVMPRVYGWMAFALSVTGLLSFLVANNFAVFSAIFSNPIIYWAIIIGELALVWILSSRIERLSFSTALAMFILYAALNGVFLSIIFYAYSLESITRTFFISAGTFGVLSLVGFTTRMNLGKIGGILLYALLGLIVATVVNLFWSNSTLEWVITYSGVLIFSGLTIYDTQKIKHMLADGDPQNESIRKYALLGALSLYLDFINLFLYLLRIFGERK